MPITYENGVVDLVSAPRVPKGIKNKKFDKLGVVDVISVPHISNLLLLLFHNPD